MNQVKPAIANKINPIFEDKPIIEVFPNPGNDKITIKIDSKSDEILSIWMTNIEGKRIREIVNKIEYTKGIHIIDFDSSEVPSGLYFILTQTKREYLINKLSIMRN